MKLDVMRFMIPNPNVVSATSTRANGQEVTGTRNNYGLVNPMAGDRVLIRPTSKDRFQNRCVQDCAGLAILYADMSFAVCKNTWASDSYSNQS